MPSHTEDNWAVGKASHQRERASEPSLSAGLTFTTNIYTLFWPERFYQVLCRRLSHLVPSGTARNRISNRSYECKVIPHSAARHLPCQEISSIHSISRRATLSNTGSTTGEPPALGSGQTAGLKGGKVGCKLEHKTYRKVRISQNTHTQQKGVKGEWIAEAGELKKKKIEKRRGKMRKEKFLGAVSETLLNFLLKAVKFLVNFCSCGISWF